MPEACLTGFLTIMEPVLMIFAGFAFFRQSGRTFAESIASALITVLLLISLCQQVGSLLSLPLLSKVVEAIGAVAAVGISWKFRSRYTEFFREVKPILLERHLVVITLLLLCWCYLLVRAILFVPSFQHIEVLNYLSTQIPGESFKVTNTLMIAQHFLGFNSFLGLGLTGFAGYLSIVFSTYALSRRYAWVPIAFTVAIITASLPRFIYHAIGPGFEIVPAAVSLFVILLTFRLIETPNFLDLILLVISITYILSHDAVSFVFAMILSALSLLLIFRRHGLIVWQLIRTHWKQSLIAIVPIVIFSRLWLFTSKSLFSDLEKNQDELMGGFANLVRYFFETIDFAQPVDNYLYTIFGIRTHAFYQRCYDRFFEPLFGQQGAALPFQISGHENEMYAWFGPLGFFFVQTAILLALVRGPRRLKAVAIALAGYIYLLTLLAAWHPENVMYFSYFYACAGFSVSLLLPPWRLGIKAKQGLQFLCMILLFYTVSML